jgi:hypothetical protein
LRIDGRSQRCALANNLAANAADMVKAVHQGGTMLELGARRQEPHRRCKIPENTRLSGP